MSANHGNTPAAWTAVVVGLIGFTIGSVGLILDPVSWPVFTVGAAVTVFGGVLFLILAKLGFNVER